jgi:hypothetical protein
VRVSLRKGGGLICSISHIAPCSNAGVRSIATITLRHSTLSISHAHAGSSSEISP